VRARVPLRLFAVSLAYLLLAALAIAQTRVNPGFNLFTADQDVQIGKQSAAEVEKEIPMLNHETASRYVARLGARLAAHAPGATYPYQFKIANLADVNAFALPGGFIYIHRGLIQSVRSEGELAGVMAHEIAHVALRHPTSQVSKAYVARAGVGVLGTLLGERSQSSTGKVMNAVGGVGLNALFLKYSRKAETQADIVGAQIMARAGYDPMEMASFFQYLKQQSKTQPSKFEQFLSDHPPPADREARVRKEAQLLGPVRPGAPVGNIASLQGELKDLPPAPTMKQVATSYR
jgi:beta-barrel assembly-enhancing protease